jgi:spermidine synthase
MVRFAFYAAVFLSAFLLFMIQPMLTKVLLPDFGGSYLVWGSAMVFFQSLLLAGYLFGHTRQCRLGVRRYARWHLALLLLPFACFPFRFHSTTTWFADVPLAQAVFFRLALLVGIPFFVLSMTSLVLQRWLMISPIRERSNPYVLYSASNAGSVLSLLVYPILIEPLFSLRTQGTMWWCGYALLVLLHGFCFPWRPLSTDIASDEAKSTSVSRSCWLRWFLLSFGACAVLLAITNMITFDLAAVPMLWVLPLTVYLVVFVLTFKRELWYPRWVSSGLNWTIVAAALVYLMQQLGLGMPPAPALCLHLSILFVLCMHASARLVATRPAHAEGLTAFYVAMAAGGLGGSLFVSWIVPLISVGLVEYLVAPAVLLVACGLTEKLKAEGRWPKRMFPHLLFDRQTRRSMVLSIGSMLLLVLLPMAFGESHVSPTLLFMIVALPVALLFRSTHRTPIITALLLVVFSVGAGTWNRFSVGGEPVASLRNFYGIYRVFDRDGQRFLQHGTTLHGRQYLDHERTSIPLGYYHPSTPAARVMSEWHKRFNDIGMVGLGTGALAVYADEQANLTIYELDPDNRRLAEQYFSYLEQSRQRGVNLDFVFGDGRVGLRKRQAASLDLLIIDAFNSGSIPVHLITTEAIREYSRILRQDGLLLLHISNRILDLAPVLYANAASVGVYACEQSNSGKTVADADTTYWMALTRDPATLKSLMDDLGWVRRRAAEWQDTSPWTDQYSHLFGAIRWFE